jgi:protein-tyrosine phosphatase
MNPQKVLFVCLGNIIRSPLAENMFRHLIEQEGLSNRFMADSAGTSAWHIGDQPDSRMRRTAASHGLTYSGSARQFSIDDFSEFDLILAMDESNRRSMVAIAPNEEAKQKVQLMRAFDPESSESTDVPDPYYGGQEGFEETYLIVERSVRGLLDWLLSEDL